MLALPELGIAGAPYPGLCPFHREETAIFFGREEQVDQLLELLEKRRFVVVLGPSGGWVDSGIPPFTDAIVPVLRSAHSA